MLLDKILYHLSQPHFSLLKTIYFNFKLLPFRIAIKLPIFIYGHVKFYWLRGRIEINADQIYKGMIKLGRNNEFFNGVDGSAFIDMDIDSKIIFEGPCAISNNYKIRISKNSILRLGSHTFFGSSVKFICTNYIYVGKYTRCAYESQIIDTNSHFVLDEKTNKIARRNGKIIIGKFNWIGNRTTFNKGGHTKDYTIVCAGSLVNKDFTNCDENHIMIGGCPAKLISSNLRRIYSPAIESKIKNYFIQHPDDKYYKLETKLVDDMSAIDFWFKNIM